MEIGGVMLAILYLTKEEWEQMQRVVDLRHSYAQVNTYYVVHVSKDDCRIIGGIAHLLLHKYEVQELRNLLREQYFFANEEEMDAIIKYAQYLLCQGDIHEDMELTDVMRQRQQMLCTLIEEYIAAMEPSEGFNVEGFFRFRMQPLWRSYPKVLETAIDEYMMEKEYRDYIAYLRNIVQDRSRQLPLLHIIYKAENDYRLLDESGNDVSTEHVIHHDQADRIVHDDPFFNHIMMINPDLVVLHYIEEDHPIAMNLRNIFADRYVYCQGCKYCQEGLESRI